MVPHHVTKHEINTEMILETVAYESSKKQFLKGMLSSVRANIVE